MMTDEIHLLVRIKFSGPVDLQRDGEQIQASVHQALDQFKNEVGLVPDDTDVYSQELVVSNPFTFNSVT